MKKVTNAYLPCRICKALIYSKHSIKKKCKRCTQDTLNAKNRAMRKQKKNKQGILSIRCSCSPYSLTVYFQEESKDFFYIKAMCSYCLATRSFSFLRDRNKK